MSRFLSSAARRVLEFIWKGTTKDSKYEKIIDDHISTNTKLKDAAERVEIQQVTPIFKLMVKLISTSGAAHATRNDPEVHVSGQVFGPTGRLTSVHAYEDGKVVYSQKKYNDAQQ